MLNIFQIICPHIKFSLKFIEFLRHLIKQENFFFNFLFMVRKLAKIISKVICCVLLISWWICWGGGIMPWGEKAINGGGGGYTCCDRTVWIMGVLDVFCCGGVQSMDWLFDCLLFSRYLWLRKQSFVPVSICENVGPWFIEVAIFVDIVEVFPLSLEFFRFLFLLFWPIKKYDIQCILTNKIGHFFIYIFF